MIICEPYGILQAVAERIQTLVQLSRGLVEELDARARSQGVSRSELVRTLLEAGLREQRAAELSGRMLEAYGRVPQVAGLDAWGDLTAWTAENSRRNRAALTAEEGEQGW